MRLLFFIVLLAVALFIILAVPRWQVRTVADVKERIELENKLRGTLAQIIGATVLLIGIFFTWQQLVDTRKFSSETLRISEQGQITERFSRSIEQLGSEKVAVRLGGIYALERIANDSFNDHWQVMQVLTAYVRQNAPNKAEGKLSSRTNKINQQTIEESNKTTEARQRSLPALDIQAILTILGRRKWQGQEGEDQRLDLSNTDLRNINLENANLSNVNFNRANLMNASLSGSNLKKGKLRFANLKQANLGEANLEGADFFGANLNGALLTRANLNNAHLGLAYLIGAYLPEANLKKAYLGMAKLEKASLRNTSMENAQLGRANLRKAVLTGANLEGASLFEANLEGAVLGQYHLLPKGWTEEFVKGFREGAREPLGANLAKANLCGAKLTGAHLRAVNLKGANLEKASLAGADLVKANLKGAQNLLINQLCEAASLFDAELDPELQKDIQKVCPPHVMQEPKPDELQIPDIDDILINPIEKTVEKMWENH